MPYVIQLQSDRAGNNLNTLGAISGALSASRTRVFKLTCVQESCMDGYHEWIYDHKDWWDSDLSEQEQLLLSAENSLVEMLACPEF